MSRRGRGDSYGQALRGDNAATGSEQEHGVVHVSGGVDDLHTHTFLLVAPRPFRLRIHGGHSLDNRQSSSLRRMFPLISASFLFSLLFRLSVRVWAVVSGGILMADAAGLLFIVWSFAWGYRCFGLWNLDDCPYPLGVLTFFNHIFPFFLLFLSAFLRI